MPFSTRIILFISNLKVAITLLLVIAFCCAIGTAIPQNEANKYYLDLYQDNHWLGILNGQDIIKLQLNHVYSSTWFLLLLAWLSIALIACSWRRQWPSIKSAVRWVDYKEVKDLRKLSIVETLHIKETSLALNKLATYLDSQGWKVKQRPCKKVSWRNKILQTIHA